jgi:hypothetical protein
LKRWLEFIVFETGNLRYEKFYNIFMDHHSTWNHRWKINKAKVYNSPIDGLGVIAMKPISKGETVFVYGGVIVPRSEIKNYWEKMGHVGIQIDDNFWICPTSRE